MLKSVEEYWQTIDEMLRKKNRNREHGEALQEAVASMLGSSEGRESIMDRLGRKGDKFPGKARFLNEVVKAFERGVETPADATAKERFRVAEAIVEHTSPKTDQAHWNMLWLLERDGYPGTGTMTLESLRKVTKKADDLSRTLPALEAWKQLGSERIRVLLEVAKRSSRDAELGRRIEPVLSWAANRLKRQSEAKAAPIRPEVETRGENVSPTQADGSPSHASQSPERILADLCGSIQELFAQELRESAKFRREHAELQDEAARLHAELKTQSELASDYIDRIRKLEDSHSERSRELSLVREHLDRLEGELAAARKEGDSARRRANDYIHDAKLALDNAVCSFQAKAWEQLRPCLTEVIDDLPQTGLNPDQVFFRRRLERIRDVLQELRISPM